MSLAHPLRRNPVGSFAKDHPGIVRLGRAGWLSKGVVYLVAGGLALLVAAKATEWSRAADAPNQEASPTGALKAIAQLSGGTALMWLMAIGMLTYAAWRVVSAVLPGGGDAKALVKRIGYLTSAVIYATFALTAVSLTRSAAASPDGNAKVSSLSDRIMAQSGGRVVIGLAGVIAIGAGLYRLVKGVRVDVSDELNLSGLSPQRRLWTRRLGAIGEIGRGIGIGLIGFFLVLAAATYDSAQATGLDGALRRLVTETWGLAVVVLVGAGFAAYGVFCLATFTHRELQAP
jgi:Domain of Unknown Function (DUF1206)